MSHALRRSTLVLVVLLSAVLFDQATKTVAGLTLAGRRPVQLLGGVFRLGYVENPGAFMNLGADLAGPFRFALFVVFGLLGLAVVLSIALFWRHLATGHALALALLAGGGISNTIDRVFNDGAVVDIVNIGVGSLHTGVFNAADVAIVLGSALVVQRMVRGRSRVVART